MSLAERAETHSSGWGWLVLWGGAVAVALLLRPILPVDETRYLSVAWEMWLRGDWLVPHLNGSPYPDKPPLLFWGILLGWRFFGVNEWWPRLLPPLFGLLSAWLLARLARRLEPGDALAGDRTLPFLSGLLWVVYSTVLLFDTLLAACVLLALLGLVEVVRGEALRGWVAYAAGVGLGILAKGPVVLVHVLPAALLAPWWTRNLSGRPSWGAWYTGLVAALLVGTGLALAWALPAAARGGTAYRAAILWDQTSGRISGSFAHSRPFWWYLPLVPVLLFPWTLWPEWWRSIFRRSRGPNPTRRFALAWVVPGFVVLSLVSGKQVHYLIPLLPGVAILAGLSSGNRRLVLGLSLVSPALLVAVQLLGRGYLERRYDLRPVAGYLKEAEASGRPIAFLGKYSGQLHFLGRIERPFDQIAPSRLHRWTLDHPSGLAVRFSRSPGDTAGAVFHQSYRGGTLGVWQGESRSEIHSESQSSEEPSRRRIEVLEGGREPLGAR